MGEMGKGQLKINYFLIGIMEMGKGQLFVKFKRRYAIPRLQVSYFPRTVVRVLAFCCNDDDRDHLHYQTP